jgi:hypothetical protein
MMAETKAAKRRALRAAARDRRWWSVPWRDWPHHLRAVQWGGCPATATGRGGRRHRRRRRAPERRLEAENAAYYAAECRKLAAWRATLDDDIPF